MMHFDKPFVIILYLLLGDLILILLSYLGGHLDKVLATG